MPSYRRSRSRRISPKRKLIWARYSGDLKGGDVPAQPAFAPPAQVDLLKPFEDVYGAQLIGCTIKRIRGLYRLSYNVPGGANVFGRATIHVTDQASGKDGLLAGTQNAYAPDSAANDYMSFEPLHTSTNGAIGYPYAIRVVDVKSQRKLSELNQSLVLRWSQRSAVAVPANEQPALTVDLSILVALP